jgi:hypothetical protein
LIIAGELGGYLRTADLAGGKVGKSRKMAGVEGLAPGRESRGEERGVNKSDAVGEGGVGNKGVGCGRGLGRGKIEVPEASVGGAGAREQQGGVAMNVKASGREGCRTAVIAQLTDGEERMGSEPRKNVGLAGGRGETRQGQGGNVAGVLRYTPSRHVCATGKRYQQERGW